MLPILAESISWFLFFYIINLQNQLTIPSDIAHDLSKPIHPFNFKATKKRSAKFSLKTEKSPKYLHGESQVKMVANSSVSSNTMDNPV
jgi:hypothetical protein